MIDMVEVRTVVDQESLRALNKHTLRYLKFVPFIFSIIFVIFAIFQFLNGEDVESRIIFGVMYLVLALVVPITIFYSVKSANKKQAASQKLISNETINYFRFEEFKIHITSDKGDDYHSDTSCAYNTLFKVVETNDHFFLYQSNITAYVIPKMDIIKGTAPDLAAIFRFKLGAKFISKVK